MSKVGAVDCRQDVHQTQGLDRAILIQCDTTMLLFLCFMSLGLHVVSTQKTGPAANRSFSTTSDHFVLDKVGF
jgi:hypothetical protein